MPELELALRDLGAGLEWPAEPELDQPVLRRIREAAPVRRRAVSRRALVIALAVLAAVVAAVFAVPQTRAAILEFFHLRGVTIERVQELPTVPVQPGLGTFLGEPVTLQEARERAGFEVVVPQDLGEPDEVYFQESPPGGMVSFVYGTRADPRALFTQFAARVDEAIFKKIASDTKIEPVTVDGQPGFWLEGAHFFSYINRHGNMESEQVRLAGNVLLWERGTRTLRLEADVSKEDALRIAESVQ